MPRKIQTSFTKSPRAVLLCVGDSLTHNNSLGVVAADFWPAQAAAALRALGTSAIGVNLGSSGRTSGQMLENINYGLIHGAPVVMAIFAGTNDAQYATTVQASPAPTTTTFSVASGAGANIRPGSWVLVGGISAQVQAVSTDSITLASPLPSAPTVGAAVAIDTTTNIVKMAEWGKAQGCSRFLVLGQHYYNFSANGDTTITQLAANATLRGLQTAAISRINDLGAVTAAGVNLYAHMSALITNGTPVNGVVFAQGDSKWHSLTNNLHLNAVGELIIANAVVAAVQSQSGWLNALT